jgi:D-alanine-D-alanine ligase
VRRKRNLGVALRIGVFVRPGRNVEMQKAYSGKEIPDDALEEATLLRDGLREAGHDARLVAWRGDDLAGVFEELKGQAIEMVFNASSDREVCFLHAAGIPYCGSGPVLVTANKATRKKIMLQDGVPTSPFVLVMPEGLARGKELSVSDLRNGWAPSEPMRYPLFVKPVEGRGSSGITDDSIVTNGGTLLRQVEMIVGRLGQGALVENHLQGREVTVGVVGDPPVALAPLEIEYNRAKTNSFAHKMDNEILHCPARLSEAAMSRVKAVALEAFDVLGARDFARVDTIVDEDGRPTVLELNTFPGLHVRDGSERRLHASYIGTIARAMGLPRDRLLGAIVDSARRRQRV